MLIDSGAEGDFLSKDFADRIAVDIKDTPCQANAVDGRVIPIYGSTPCAVTLVDSAGVSATTERHLLLAGMKSYDVILGMPWLEEVNPIIDWSEKTWRYPSQRLFTVCAELADLQLDSEEEMFALCYKPYSLLKCIPLGATQIEDEEMEDVRSDVVWPSVLKDFADVAQEGQEGIFPTDTRVEHSIPLMEGTTAPHGPIYPLSGKELEVLREYLDDALAKGWIQASESPAGAPILFVPKKDGSLRLCVDYRALNKVTIKNRYPLPLIPEILDRLGGSRYFTKLDIRDAYHRIRIKKEDRWKTAFRTRYGHFEYLVMPFGLTNAPASFQGYINTALAGLLDGVCVAYMDDILIYSTDYETHVKHVRSVLERLREFSLFVKLSKCEFFVQQVDFLGFRIGIDGVAMDPSKVSAIREWREPESYTEIQSFLGFTNFYRQFIANYSKLTTPITNLLIGMERGRKHGPFMFPDDAKEAFRTLKQRFEEAPLLKHYDPMRPCRIETDASGKAIGAVISQPYEAYGDSSRTAWHPIAFLSKKLGPAEQNYSTGDQEMLAIVTAFRTWRQYLESPAKTTRVITDHEALVKFMDNKPLSRKRQTRWAEELSVYDFETVWRRGKDNPADALSRRADHMEGVEEQEENALFKLLRERAQNAPSKQIPAKRAEDGVMLSVITRAQAQSKPSGVEENEFSTLHKPALVVKKKHVKTQNGDTNDDRENTDESGDAPQDIRSVDETLASRLRDLQERDAFCRERQWIKLKDDAFVNGAKKGAWSVDPAGIVRVHGVAYIPKDARIRREILRVNHDDPWQGGHFGRKRTLEVIRRYYWWPKVKREVYAYVDTCDVCQRMKAPRHKPYGLLESLPIPEGPWQDITMDFVTGLPPAKHRRCIYDAILVVVDRFSKMVKFIPTTTDVDSAELANILCDDVFAAFGTPRSIVSDRGTVFTAKYWGTLCYTLAIRRNLSTAFHPQTDGQTERTNQTLECYLRSYVNYEQSDWAMLLASAEYACNNAKNATTKKTPFEMVLTFQPTVGKNLDIPHPQYEMLSAKERAARVLDAQRELKASWEHAQSLISKRYDKKRSEVEYQVGQRVMLSAKNIRTRKASEKLSDKLIGPFEIEKRIGKNAYRLRLPQKYGQLHPVFHVSLLQEYHMRSGCEPPEPIDIDDSGVQEFEVERILDHGIKGKNKSWYLVRWRGYGEAHDTWEPEEHLAHAQEAIENFKLSQGQESEM